MVKSLVRNVYHASAAQWLLMRMQSSSQLDTITPQWGQPSSHEVRTWNQQFPIRHELVNPAFLHIGKCGGTTLSYSFLSSLIRIREFHMTRPSALCKSLFFTWVRDPISRYISAFNHSKVIVEYDVTTVNSNTVSIDDSPAPRILIGKQQRGFAITPEYDSLVKEFPSANALAESMTSVNPSLRRKACKLMNHQSEHIYKGVGWYLWNGLLVEKKHQQFFFVGKLESMDDDFERLKKMINCQTNVKLIRKRTNDSIVSEPLSPSAISNLRRFYWNTDYKALSALAKHGLIDKSYLEQCLDRVTYP